MIVQPLADIIVPEERQRRIFDDASLQELADSIADKGLMHPIVVRNDSCTLVAGERRLRALRILSERGTPYRCNGEAVFSGGVVCVRLSDLSEFQVREAEFEENVLRRDLAWQELNYAIAGLHRLREEQAASENRTQTVQDTANEILGRDATGVQHTKITKALQIADNLHDPEIANAKTEKEALKILERRANEEHRANLAREFGERSSKHEIRQGSAFEFLPGVPDSSINIILTDPPYGIGADDFGDQADARHDYEDTVDYAFKCYSLVFTEANRICKDSAQILLFCDIRVFPTLYDLALQVLEEAWSTWETPLIWDKGNGMLPVPDRGPRRNYEAILYAYSGNRKWNTTGSSDIISIPGLSRPEFGAQKPTELYSDLLFRVSQPGDIVLDPFAGTCPIIPAAAEYQCQGIALEINEAKINFALTEYKNV